MQNINNKNQRNQIKASKSVEFQRQGIVQCNIAALYWIHGITLDCILQLFFDESIYVKVVSSIFSKDGFTGPNRKVWAFFLGACRAAYHPRP